MLMRILILLSMTASESLLLAYVSIAIYLSLADVNRDRHIEDRHDTFDTSIQGSIVDPIFSAKVSSDVSILNNSLLTSAWKFRF